MLSFKKNKYFFIPGKRASMPTPIRSNWLILKLNVGAKIKKLLSFINFK